MRLRIAGDYLNADLNQLFLAISIEPDHRGPARN